MHRYKVELFQPMDTAVESRLTQQVQEQLDAHARSGWRLVNIVNVAGATEPITGRAATRLLLVFESVEETATGAVTARKAPKTAPEFVCSDCGGDLTEDAKVCPHCGAPIEDD